MFGEATAVMTAEGLRGLWRGVLPSLYRTVPGVGLYFSSMHWMRYSVFQGKPNAGQSLLIGRCQDFCWLRNDSLYCRQDQDRVWSLS